MLLDTVTGCIERAGALPEKSVCDAPYRILLRKISVSHGEFYHMELVLCESGRETVLNRFVGNEHSVSENPFSKDNEKAVFFGYASSEDWE